nr:E-beta-farnesene synthase [Tanacetum cinerariifolium]
KRGGKPAINDQILPHIRWVPIGKSNCYLDLEKSQSNQIYKIATAGCYKCQLDKQWFDLTKYTLGDALQITPVNNKAFSSPPSCDALINFVNELGYPKLVRNLSNVILWGVVNRAHIDYAERIEEEFTQSFHTFIEDKKNLEEHTHGKKKAPPIVIPSIRFTKLIIYYLQRKHKFHPRPDSPLHFPNEEPVLGYLKFNAKGTKREVFMKHIPGNIITTDIKGEAYYQEYLEKVSKHQRYLADLRPPVTKPASSQQPEPQPAPAKSLGKKRKLVTEISNKPSSARKSRPGLVTKRHKPTSSLRSVDESVAEGILEKEPRVDDEEADVQRALEESLKSIYDVPRGLLPPVVIRELESGKYQPLPKVQGKGKEKVTDEQVARDLLTLQTPKKKSPADQFIFQRHTSTPTGSSGHDESSSLYVELGLTDSVVESDEDVTKIYTGVQASRPLPSPIVHAGPNLEHMDLERPESPNVHQPLKAIATETTTTTTIHPPPSQPQQSTTDSMLMKRIGELKHIMANLIQDNKHLEERLDSHGARLYTLENLDIPQQAIQAPLRNRFRDLPEADMKEILHQRIWETNSYKTHEDHMMLFEALEKSMNRDHSKELLKDLAEAYKKKKKRHDLPKTPPGSPPHQPPPPPPPAGPSGALGSHRASGSSQVLPPPPPPLSTNQEGQSHGFTAPSSSKTAASAEYKAWTMTDTRLRPSTSDDEDIKNAHILKVNLRQDWWKPLKKDRPATPEPAWSIPSSDVPIPKNNWASALASTYSPPPEDSLLAHNVNKPLPLGGPPGQVTIQSDFFFFNKDLEYLRYNSKGSRPALSISKMKSAYYPNVSLEQMVPDQMWIEEECKYDIAAIYGISHWWFQKQRFYNDRHTSEGDRRPVRTHIWILSVVRIEVFSMYGYDYMKKIVLHRADLHEHIITERDFKYLYPSDFEDLYLLNLQGHLNHLPPKDKKILTTAVNLWTKHLVIRQCIEDFLLGIESYQTQLNLTKPRWDATGFEYKYDYTVIDSSRAITFRDRYGVQMIMRFNEIHKFSDGTLHQINEALDYQVKEFKVNMMNPGLNTRFWTMKDVDRSNEFMLAIQKRLKTRIFRNLESFIGG